MNDIREKLARVIDPDAFDVSCDEMLHAMNQDESLRIADAIIATLPGMVQPLVWETADEQHFKKSHCHGRTEEIAYLAPLDWYRVYPASDGKWRWVRQFRMTYIDGNKSNDPEPESAAAAKAAAQAHHVATIMQAFGVQGESK